MTRLERLDEWHHRHYPHIKTPRPGWKSPLWWLWYWAWRPLCNHLERKYLGSDYKLAKTQRHRAWVWSAHTTTANSNPVVWHIPGRD